MTTYVMEAKENYDAASAAELSGSTQSAAFSLDPTYIACGYDYNRRKMMYLGCIIPSVDAGSGTFPNATGHTLYDGGTRVYAPLDDVTVPPYGFTAGPTSFSPQVCQKDIDTGAATFFPTYSPSATVPADVGCTYLSLSNFGNGYTNAAVAVSGGGGTGMQAVAILDAGGDGRLVNVHVTNWGTGYTATPTFTVTGDGAGATIVASDFISPSDGSWRWIGANFGTSSRHPNGPSLVNPRNSDFWTVSTSCEIYQYRYADNFAQVIGPALVAINANPYTTPTPSPVGIDTTWCYALTNPKNQGGVTSPLNLVLVPSAIQSDETAAAAKLTYVLWDTAPFNQDYGARLTFGADGKVYVFSITPNGDLAWNWRLTRYEPPSLETFGTNAPGTMTDVTPWGAAAGPNATGADYFLTRNANGSLHFAMVRLPATNQLAAVLKFPKENSNLDTSDYANTVFSCVYVTLGATPTYDYHSGFVTGYMDASWQPAGAIPTTGWAVVDCRETNNFQEQSDYVYSGLDYTKRWFVFQCYPISGGAVDTSHGLMDVFVQYRFSSGAAPVVVSSPAALTDPDWSDEYPAYQTAIGQPNAVYNSTVLGTVPNGDFDYTVWLYPDPGLYDPATNAFWFSGVTEWQGAASDTAYNAMFYLDSAFTPRAALNDSGQPNAGYGPVSPPFLRLSFGEPRPVFANSFVRSYVGNPQL